MITLKKDNKWGFLYKTGKEAVPFIYWFAYPFSNGLACVAKSEDTWENAKFGFVDKTGREVVPLIYDRAFGFDESFAVVQKDGEWKILEIVDYSPVAISPNTRDSFNVLLFPVCVVILAVGIKIKRCTK